LEKKIIDKLDTLDLHDTSFLLDKDIDSSLDYFTRKRIETSIRRKTGYYNTNNNLVQKINNILGGTIMKRKIALVLSAITICGLGGGVYAHAKTTPVAYVS
jgi:hypothetical protein